MQTKIQTIQEMTETLKSNPEILALIEYGNPHNDDNYKTGDYDLFAVLKTKHSDVESLHFYVDKTPVDLNIRTLKEIKELKFVTGFDEAILDGRIIYDPTKKIKAEIQKLRKRHKKNNPTKTSAHTIAFTRHGHKHIFDKIKGRLENMPLLCKILLNANIYWLIESYFKVRNMQFKGEKHALAYFKKNETKIHKAITAFYSVNTLRKQVEISKRLTSLILSPVDGAWKDDEILAFGNENIKNLQKNGNDLFRKLFMS